MNDPRTLTAYRHTVRLPRCPRAHWVCRLTPRALWHPVFAAVWFFVAASALADETDLVLEKQHLRLASAAATGGWTSFIDKQSGDELVLPTKTPVTVAPPSVPTLDSSRLDRAIAGEKLRGLIEDVSRQIQGKRGEIAALSPSGRRPEELLEMVKSELPVWVIVATSVALVLLFYVGLSFLTGQDASYVANELRRLLQEVRG